MSCLRGRRVLRCWLTLPRRRKKAQLAAGTSSPEPLPPAVSEAMNPTHDWLYHDLSELRRVFPVCYPLTLFAIDTAQSSQPHFPIASTSRIDPVGEDPLAAFTAVYPTPIPHVNVVSPPAPSPATGGFSLKKLLGARGEAPPRHSLADAFAVEEELQSASPVAEKVFEDIVTAQVCPPEVVDELFAL